ncbi:transporter substrate-binding domain-containing protein [Pseudahrensia aquimaris]|uniref:Transporter substrate-binding domain-containing protein n=1 Tax=Pseudahrensia aquimaris TaxID=744461 RepID=A0ABW3FKR5_9HYPH
MKNGLWALVGALVALWSALAPVQAADEPVIPNFWDAQERIIRPNIRNLPRLRFLTITDFPPFSYIDKDKRLAGFHVELARAICEKLELTRVCQIQALPFDELESALKANNGDAILAGIAVTPQSAARLNFSRPYFRLPARFVTKTANAPSEPLITSLAEQEIGVVADTAHAAFAQATFASMRVRMFANHDDALASLEKDEIRAVFGDALKLAYWLQTPKGTACCQFTGQAYLSEQFFGSGLTVATRLEDVELTEAMNYALREINDRGIFAELYLRYFPISLY